MPVSPALRLVALSLIALSPLQPAPAAATELAPKSQYDVSAALARLPAPGIAPPASPVPRGSTEIVSSSRELASALHGGSRRIACMPGSTFTQPVAITRPDVLLDMSGCTVSDGRGANILRINTQRVRLVGGEWDGGFEIGAWSRSRQRTAEDVHIVGATFRGRAQGSSSQVMFAERVLLERIDLASGAPDPGVLTLWVQGSNDVVVANSRIVQTMSGQATLRSHASKIAVMDSFIANPTHHTLRAHAEGPLPSPYVYWGRNVVQGGRIQAWGGPGDPLQVEHLWIVDNAFYWNATATFISSPSVATAVITGNRVFDAKPYTWSSAPGWTVEKNVSRPFGAPDPWRPR
jgi:hypothetical protein